MKPKIPTELPAWMLTCPRFHHYAYSEREAHVRVYSTKILQDAVETMVLRRLIDPTYQLGNVEHPVVNERHAVTQIPSEVSEERVMFPEDLLAGMGKVPWPEAVYVLANEESGTHAVTRNQRGLVCYETITRAKDACLRPKNSHFTPNSVTPDEAIVIALDKQPELTCVVLFRDEGDEPLIWYIR